MSNPYNYPFIQRDNTMYLSTISNFPLIQASKTSTHSRPTTDRVRSSKKISLELPLKSSFLRNPTIPTFNSPPT